MNRTIPVVPTYRALTIVGTVLKKDEQGAMYHAVTVTTTLGEEIVVLYDVVSKAARHRLSEGGR